MPKKSLLGDAEALDGLAEAWNRNSQVRGVLLNSNSMLCWPKANLTGVITFKTASYNWKVLTRVLRIWLPTIDKLKSININAARKQARYSALG